MLGYQIWENNRLQLLSLEGLGISNIPESIQSLNRLEYLNLNNNNLNSVETNQLYESLIELSNTFPASYGLFCIFLAVGLGILASVFRRSVSNFRKKHSLKKAAW